MTEQSRISDERLAELVEYQSGLAEEETFSKYVEVKSDGHSFYEIAAALRELVLMRDEVTALLRPRPWATCRTHGPEKPNEWGCPDCVAKMRSELVLIKEALVWCLAHGSRNVPGMFGRQVCISPEPPEHLRPILLATAGSEK